MNILTVAADQPFLDVLARWWLDGSGEDGLDVADGLLLLPTRRAARGLAEAFLRVSAGRALMLPRIAALGGIDEAPLAMAGALDLPPALEEQRRLAALARLVLAMEGLHGTPRTADGAWRLARELAALLDEAHRAGVSLPATLPDAAAAGYAEHWQRTLRFLAVVTEHFPRFLREEGATDAAARALALLDAQGRAWRERPPPGRVVVAGTTGGIDAVARLMKVVAELERGAVVLPGLDLDMDEESWAALDDSHPQAGLARLLARMGAARGDVAVLGAPAAGRVGTVSRALLPAVALPSWRAPFRPAIEGLRLLEAADQQEEAVAVALVLRGALERPGARAALVTPDRGLAVRVAAELGRFGVVADDSAGEALAQTPPAALLRLLARTAADRLAPVGLLAVLKHPLAAFGLAPGACRSLARYLERECLRGPAPTAGLAGLRARLPDGDAGLAEFVERLADRLGPLLDLSDAAPDRALATLIAVAERVADTDTQAGSDRLWALEEGEALAAHLAALGPALALLPPQAPTVLPGLLEATMEGAVVRSRRALRGRDGAEHPRIAILGLLEARLQSFDVLVLGGLTEGVWPAATDPGPWMSRPIRRAVGLNAPEELVGQMAHDFATLSCAAPAVVLSCPRRRDGAPAVPSRWLVRLGAFLRGHGAALPQHPAASWARLLDLPAGGPVPVGPPEPRPPRALRPRKLSVTEIETWLRDPFAIYAKHVLRLRALAPLEENADAADYGTVVHKAVAAFVAALPSPVPADAASLLRDAMDAALAARSLRPALANWWRPRLHRIADWVAAEEGRRRAGAAPVAVACEVKGRWPLPDGADFTLSGTADRVEMRADGTLSLLDYKTGTLPTAKDVRAGYASQLPLEAAMAAAGAFGPELAGPPGEMAYWRLSGGNPPGETQSLKQLAELVQEAVTKLQDLVRLYDDEAQPYRSRPHPGAVPRFSDYAQVARAAEWSVLPEEDG